ncbi:MAG: hypothetical protein K2J24_03690, partial [Muribaculaceae bacterium]|nr:hypothetical protein [Muribaculaceae bacterium]
LRQYKMMLPENGTLTKTKFHNIQALAALSINKFPSHIPDISPVFIIFAVGRFPNYYPALSPIACKPLV